MITKYNQYITEELSITGAMKPKTKEEVYDKLQSSLTKNLDRFEPLSTVKNGLDSDDDFDSNLLESIDFIIDTFGCSIDDIYYVFSEDNNNFEYFNDLIEGYDLLKDEVSFSNDSFYYNASPNYKIAIGGETEMGDGGEIIAFNIKGFLEAFKKDLKPGLFDQQVTEELDVMGAMKPVKKGDIKEKFLILIERLKKEHNVYTLVEIEQATPALKDDLDDISTKLGYDKKDLYMVYSEDDNYVTNSGYESLFVLQEMLTANENYIYDYYDSNYYHYSCFEDIKFVVGEPVDNSSNETGRADVIFFNIEKLLNEIDKQFS